MPVSGSDGRVTMTPSQLASAARNLAYGLGIPVYVRDGRIYQNGPGLAFFAAKRRFSSGGSSPRSKRGNGRRKWVTTLPKVVGPLLMATPILWFTSQVLTFQALRA
jgi:hypothetical protein